MRVEKSKSKRAHCSICGEKITDDYRVFDWGNRETLYYHIDCVITVGEKLKKVTNLAQLIQNPVYPHHRGIPISRL